MASNVSSWKVGSKCEDDFFDIKFASHKTDRNFPVYQGASCHRR